MPETVILGTARTPFGKMGGALAPKSAIELGGEALSAALERSGVDPEQVQQVVFGQVLQAGQGQIPRARPRSRRGIPKEVPSETVNKVCASGMRSIGLADQAIRAGDLEVAATGGMESMSGAPYMLPGPLRLPDGRREGDRRDDPRRADQPLHRQADDQRGQRGLQRARDHPRRHGPLGRPLAPARREGDRRGPARRGDRSGHREDAARPRPWSRPTRRSGPTRRSRRWRSCKAVGGDDATHTAGNAPGRERRRRRRGRRLRGVGRRRRAASRSRRSSPTAPSPTTSPISRARPAKAAKPALEKIGKSPEDVDLWEINEAFASVAINSVRMLGVDEEKVNVNGGAIALGHPIGASGARIIGAPRPRAAPPRRRPGVAAICSGGGQGDAIVLEVNGG